MLKEFPRKKRELTEEDKDKLREYKRKWANSHYNTHPRQKTENSLIECGCGCGKKLLKCDKKKRVRKFIHGHQAILYKKAGEKPPHHEIQYLSIWNKIRKAIYKRDEWICQECKKHCSDDIQCHHVIPYRISRDNSSNNLITLCHKCHTVAEHRFNKSRKLEIGNWENFLDTPHFERKYNPYGDSLNNSD